MSPRYKIIFEVKIREVLNYLNKEKSISQICNELDISDTVFREWVRKYNVSGPEGLMPSAKNKIYPPDIKQLAVEDYLSNKGSLDKICSKYNISCHRVLRRWIMKYNNHNITKSHSTEEKKIMIKGRKTTYPERIKIVGFCIENNDNYQLTSDKYQVSYQQVYTWVRKYKKDGQEALLDHRGKDKKYNHKRIYRLMKSIKLKSIIRKKRKKYIKSTPQITAENILNRKFNASSSNEKWLTDVTEFKLNNGKKAYLSAIFDLGDNSIVSYVLGHSNNNKLVFDTLDEAVKNNPTASPLFHSDRGFQYTHKISN
jgi:transposase-like protein